MDIKTFDYFAFGDEIKPSRRFINFNLVYAGIERGGEDKEKDRCELFHSEKLDFEKGYGKIAL